nr:hypothetical protein [Tanacetum cinerariifolium]
ELELKDHVVGILDLHNEWNEAEVQESEAEEKLSLIYAERVILKDCMRKASLKCPGDGKFVALYEKYVNLFKDPISFEDDGNEDNVGDDDDDDENGDDDAEEKLSLICVERVILEDYMRKASLKCPGDGKFVALHEKYVNLFKDPISFENDKNRDNVGDDDDENGDDDGGNVDNHSNDCDGNGDEEDVNEGDKDPNGGNPSFGFSKINLEDFGNDSGPAEKDKAVEGNPTEQGTIVEGNEAEEGEIMSTPKNFTQYLTKTTAMTILDYSPGTYYSKYKEVCDLLKKLFARHLKQYGHIRHTQVAKVKHTIPKLKWKTTENFHDCEIFTMLYMETFDGGPASNLDCGLPVESQLQRDMLRRLRFKFATKILLHEINVHAGKMLELAKEFDKADHVEKMAIIVDAFKKREERTYDSKYKEVCDLLKKLFARKLKRYGPIRHTQVAKVKHTIPKLKCKTKENFHDCVIFTMLHMETFDGGPASNLDCGLLVES